MKKIFISANKYTITYIKSISFISYENLAKAYLIKDCLLLSFSNDVLEHKLKNGVEASWKI